MAMETRTFTYGGSENPPEIRMGNGDGTFRDAQVPPGFFLGLLPLTSEFALVGDFNGDGVLDIASRNFSMWTPLFGKRSTLSLGLPGGTFSYASPTGQTANNIVAADFNGDGKLDIADNLSVSYGTGDGLFGPVGDTTNFSHVLNAFAVGGSFPPTRVAVGDVDGNGSPDLIAATDGGVVQVVLNTSGHPALLAKVALFTNLVHSVVGGATTVSGTVALDGPALPGGALVTLSSSDPAASFPDGNTVVIPAGSQAATFSISTAAVAASTPVTISATKDRVTLA